MKKLACIAVVAGIGLGAMGQGSPAWISMWDCTGSETDRAVTFTPLDGPMGVGGGHVVASGPIVVQPVGGTGMTNLVMGNYRVTFAGLASAMTIFWPEDASITNVADARIRTSGLVRQFTLWSTNLVTGITTGGVGLTVSAPLVLGTNLGN